MDAVADEMEKFSRLRLKGDALLSVRCRDSCVSRPRLPLRMHSRGRAIRACACVSQGGGAGATAGDVPYIVGCALNQLAVVSVEKRGVFKIFNGFSKMSLETVFRLLARALVFILKMVFRSALCLLFSDFSASLKLVFVN